MSDAQPMHGLGLGLDVGGSETRWVLADAAGVVLSQGRAPAFSGAQAGSALGQQQLREVLAGLAQQVHAVIPSATPLAAVQAGITGFDPLAQHAGVGLPQLLSQALQVPQSKLMLFNDVELAYRLNFALGEGFLLYAGTGSIAVFIDAEGRFERAGGRGAVLGDEGSGAWLGTQALATVWRAEDEAPGAWRQSVLAKALFSRLGDESWSTTRQFVHRASRGDWGLLALAVAEAANQGDEQALGLLGQAGEHLVRLARALERRFGRRPLALAGRVWGLHPMIEARFRQGLGDAWVPTRRDLRVAAAAARQAALGEL